ncbi:MAG: DMT family transporter [Desulfurococcaceae archaeon]
MSSRLIRLLKLLAISSIIWASISSASILVLLSGAPAEVCAFWRLALSIPLIYILGVFRGESVLSRAKRHHLVSGVALGLHFIMWMNSLFLLPVYFSTLLVTIYPLYSLILDVIVFRRRLSISQALGLVICACLLVIYLEKYEMIFCEGTLLAAIAGLAAAVYFEVGSYARFKLGEPTTSYALNTYLVASLSVMLYALIRGVDPVGYAPISYFYFVLMAAVPMVLGHTLMNYLLGYLPAPLVTAISYGEPFGAGLLAHFILGQDLGAIKVLLGLTIIATAFITITGFGKGDS